MKLPKPIQNLIDAFERLPGIGSKTAARLTFYLLHVPEVERQRFGQALLELGEKTATCERCFNICDSPAGEASGSPQPRGLIRKPPGFPDQEGEAVGVKESAGSEGVLCDICSEANRDQSVICVVEEPLDLMAFERTGKYNGLYHVLQGVIAPLEHIGPEDLRIDELVKRLQSTIATPVAPGVTAEGRSNQQSAIDEIILATNPSLEGEATAMYIKQLISKQLTADGNTIKITRIARGIPTGGDLEYADQTTLTKALEGRQDY